VASTFPQITNSFFQGFIEKEKNIPVNRYRDIFKQILSKYKEFSILVFYLGNSEIYIN
jgi:hypothetical protein